MEWTALPYCLSFIPCISDSLQCNLHGWLCKENELPIWLRTYRVLRDVSMYLMFLSIWLSPFPSPVPMMFLARVILGKLSQTTVNIIHEVRSPRSKSRLGSALNYWPLSISHTRSRWAKTVTLHLREQSCLWKSRCCCAHFNKIKSL